MELRKQIPTMVFTIIIVVSLAIALPARVSAQGTYDCFYNACSVGPICDLGQQFYSPGDFVFDKTLRFNVGERKIIPQPYYEEYKDFVCKADECDSAYGDTWYCTSAIIGGTNVNRIQQCPNFAEDLPFCNLNACELAASSSPYCEVGAIRQCDEVGLNSWWYECTTGGWNLIYPFPVPVPGWPSGTCYSEPQKEPPPWMYCLGGDLGVPGSGWWQDSPFEFVQGRCEDMLVSLTAGMTPGYVKTYTPHLFDIWQNTVASTQAVFSIFRTQLDKEIYDWPGESSVAYDFDPFSGSGFAMAGYPPRIQPGSAARIYFRYLGYIHCAKENLLQKLSSMFDDPPYIYYDARCDVDLW